MNPDEYRGGWKTIGAVRNAGFRPTGRLSADEAREDAGSLADSVFTDLGVLAIVTGEVAGHSQFLAVETTLSHETSTLTPEQVQKSRGSVLYDEVKDALLWGGKPSSRLTAKMLGDKPLTLVGLTKKARIGLPLVALQFSARLPVEEVRGFLRRTPLASKIKEKR